MLTLILLLLRLAPLITLEKMALIFLRLANSAGMRSVFRAVEVNHAIYASIGRAIALATMGIEFLLGEHIATILR